MRHSRGAQRVRGPVSSAAVLLGLLGAGAIGVLTPQRVAWAVDTTQLPDPALQARYSGLTHELRCMQCQNEAIADSPVDLAADLRREVRDMLLAGKSDDDVRNFMAARYGDFILFRPRFLLRTAWLWLAPGVLLLVGAFVSWRIVRARTALVSQDNAPLEEDVSR
jgi:cytochrome c-type biogenesis protein CcmH